MTNAERMEAYRARVFAQRLSESDAARAHRAQLRKESDAAGARMRVDPRYHAALGVSA